MKNVKCQMLNTHGGFVDPISLFAVVFLLVSLTLAVPQVLKVQNINEKAAGGCSSNTTSKTCTGCGGVKADGKSYECVWRSASSSCNESANVCGGSAPSGPIASEVVSNSYASCSPSPTYAWCGGCGGFCIKVGSQSCSEVAQSKCGVVTSYIGPTCDANSNGAIVVNGTSDGSYFVKCNGALGKWEPAGTSACTTCLAQMNKANVPTYLQAEYDTAVKAITPSTTTVIAGIQPDKVANPDLGLTAPITATPLPSTCSAGMMQCSPNGVDLQICSGGTWVTAGCGGFGCTNGKCNQPTLNQTISNTVPASNPFTTIINTPSPTPKTTIKPTIKPILKPTVAPTVPPNISLNQAIKASPSSNPFVSTSTQNIQTQINTYLSRTPSPTPKPTPKVVIPVQMGMVPPSPSPTPTGFWASLNSKVDQAFGAGSMFEGADLSLGGNLNSAVPVPPSSILLSNNPQDLANYYKGTAYAAGSGAALAAGALAVGVAPVVVPQVGAALVVPTVTQATIIGGVSNLASAVGTATFTAGAVDCAFGVFNGTFCEQGMNMAVTGMVNPSTFNQSIGQGLNQIVTAPTKIVDTAKYLGGITRIPATATAPNTATALNSGNVVDEGVGFQWVRNSVTGVMEPVAINAVTPSITQTTSNLLPSVTSTSNNAIQNQAILNTALSNWITRTNPATVAVGANIINSLAPSIPSITSSIKTPTIISLNALSGASSTTKLPTNLLTTQTIPNVTPQTGIKLPVVSNNSPTTNSTVPNLMVYNFQTKTFEPASSQFLAPPPTTNIINTPPVTVSTTQITPPTPPTSPIQTVVNKVTEFFGLTPKAPATVPAVAPSVPNSTTAQKLDQIVSKGNDYLSPQLGGGKGLGCRGMLCETSSDFIVDASNKAGLPSQKFEVRDLNIARGIPKTDSDGIYNSFGHYITIITDPVTNDKYLVDLTFNQFVDPDRKVIRNTNRTIYIGPLKNYPIAQELIDKGYIKLTDQTLNDYLNMTTKVEAAQQITIKDLDNLKTPKPVQPQNSIPSITSPTLTNPITTSTNTSDNKIVETVQNAWAKVKGTVSPVNAQLKPIVTDIQGIRNLQTAEEVAQLKLGECIRISTLCRIALGPNPKAQEVIFVNKDGSYHGAVEVINDNRSLGFLETSTGQIVQLPYYTDAGYSVYNGPVNMEKVNGLVDPKTSLPPTVIQKIDGAMASNKFINLTENSDTALNYLKEIATKNGATVVEVPIPISGIQSPEEAFDIIAIGFEKSLGQPFPKSGYLAPLMDMANNIEDLVVNKKLLLIISDVQNMQTNVDQGENLLLSIRSLYNDRAVNPEMNNLQVVLDGKVSPKDIRPQGSTRSPYNIGEDIVSVSSPTQNPLPESTNMNLFEKRPDELIKSIDKSFADATAIVPQDGHISAYSSESKPNSIQSTYFFGRSSSSQIIESQINLNDGSKTKILDVGAANGGMLLETQSRYGDAVELHGLSAHDYRTSTNPLTGINYKIGNAEYLNNIYEPNSFDVITSAVTFIHLKDPLGSLEQMYNLLKPNGVMAVDELGNLASLEGNIENILIYLKNNGYDVTAGYYHEINPKTGEFTDSDINYILIRKTKPTLDLPVEYSGISSDGHAIYKASIPLSSSEQIPIPDEITLLTDLNTIKYLGDPKLEFTKILETSYPDTRTSVYNKIKYKQVGDAITSGATDQEIMDLEEAQLVIEKAVKAYDAYHALEKQKINTELNNFMGKSSSQNESNTPNNSGGIFGGALNIWNSIFK